MTMWMLIAVAAILVLMLVVLMARRRGGPAERVIPDFYERVGSLMSPVERKFYDLLQEATGESFRIFPKVALASLIHPKSEGDKALDLPMEILGRKVDFVLCSADDFAVLAAIRLVKEIPDAAAADGGAGGEESGAASLALDPLEEALTLADLSVAHLDPRENYTPGDLQKHLADSLSLPMKVFGQATHRLSEKPKATPLKRGTDGSPLCPSCDATMTQRTAKQGRHAGRTFWVCSNFPTCKKVLPVKS